MILWGSDSIFVFSIIVLQFCSLSLRQVWEKVLREELDLKVGGHVFSEEELQKYFSYLKTLLQHSMKEWPQGSKEKYELNICSTTLGKPGEGERTSFAQCSFQRDLTLICESAGVTGSQLFVSNDQ